MIINNPLRANPTKWSNTLKQFVGKLPTNYLSVFDHLVKLALKGLTNRSTSDFLHQETLAPIKQLLHYLTMLHSDLRYTYLVLFALTIILLTL